jgi:hypothetical protein
LSCIDQSQEPIKFIEKKDNFTTKEKFFCQVLNLSDADCNSIFDEIKNKSTKNVAKYNQNSRGLVIIKDNDKSVDGLRDLLPFILFQLIGKRNNVVPTVEPELTQSTIDPILIALLTQQQQQQASQPFTVLFQPSSSQVPVSLTCATNPFSGVLNNQSLSFFLNQGFSVIYNYTYEHNTTTQEINDIRNNCSESNILCMGGLDITNNVLLVVACGCCLDVLSVTVGNQTQLHNGVYWYNTPTYSIGFAPNSTIIQTYADQFDLGNNQRVSWHLDLGIGGYRVGSIVTSSAPYYKIYLKSP